MTDNENEEWFLQRKNFGLGNFVNATPFLRLLYKKRGNRKIDVFFQGGFSELYGQEFINVLETRPEHAHFAGAVKL